MAVAIFIAKIAALIYLCVGLGALFNKKHFQKVMEDYCKNAGLDYLGALMALVLGFLLVGSYNVWAWNWAVLVTLLGWGCLLKGVLHLIFPEQTMKFSERFLKGNWLGTIAWVCIILGLFFGYYGFVAV